MTLNAAQPEITRPETILAEEGQALEILSPEAVLRRLAEPGVLLLRGFTVDADRFERFTALFCKRFHRPAARASLQESSGDGTTTRAPEGNFTLLAHNEASYRPFRPPDLAFFLCIEPPSMPGGETLVVDGRAFLSRMPGDLAERFSRQGVIFEARWDQSRWRTELDVDDATGLERLNARYPQLTLNLRGQHLTYRCRGTAVQTDSQGVAVFANAILAHLPAINHPGYENASPYAKEGNQVYFGDGEPLSEGVINALIDIQDAVGYSHPLERDDVLVIDNTRVMHGRRPMARDCERVLLTRFGYLREEWVASQGWGG